MQPLVRARITKLLDRLVGREHHHLRMRPFEKCPVCGGELVEKHVEKLLRGGPNTAVVGATADVCLHCGERLYSEETARRFEEIRRKLELKETREFEPVGRFFKVR